MKPQIIGIAGFTGTGKSYFTKAFLENAFDAGYEPLIYDVNGEYRERWSSRAKTNLPMNEFVQLILKAKNKCIVCEEATIFFKNPKRAEILATPMVLKRHRRLVMLLLFHSLRSIPIDIFDYLNYLVLYGTNDRPDIIYSKYKDNPEIIDAFNAVQARYRTAKNENDINFHYSKTIELMKPSN